MTEMQHTEISFGGTCHDPLSREAAAAANQYHMTLKRSEVVARDWTYANKDIFRKSRLLSLGE